MGLIVPVLTFFVIYMVKEADMNLRSYFDFLYSMKVLPKLMSLCLLPNLILFFGFMRLDKLRSARGIILSLFIFAIPILILKFV